MARKDSPTQKSQKQGAKSEGPVEIFQQMEELQRELLVLAKRAETELEALLLSEPEPVTRMLENFAARVKATEVVVSFDPQGRDFRALGGFKELQLLDHDRQQCLLALSGREMAMDFASSRVFFPVVVFENPIAVAVLRVPRLNTQTYADVCTAACEGICQLRNELRIPRQASVITDVAS